MKGHKVSQPETRTLATPGAVLTYDVRPGDGPLLLLIGSPMQAEGFATLAGHFPDRTVVTYDPRGIARSERTDGVIESTPDEHADDIAAIIEEVSDGGPVDVFGSSGGAVNTLALVSRHPTLVRTLIAHEPPSLNVLSDRETATAATVDIYETYQKSGAGPAMVKFFLLTGAKGEIPAGFGDQPAPDPAQFGLPAEDTGDRTDPLLGQNLMTCTHYEHDFEALKAAPTRIVVAVGAESVGELAHRGGEGVAARLGTEAVTFPSHHGGFLGGEFGMTGDPDGFAAALREALR
ncbi:Pimeloyl-ACP methyl ester carboxylesterase [Paractinoplanes atraurantiacus]|uniref:Pimeloyl-ACP methyl ester carboxylesterase n=1 Tax=Paractinoplanes atraurantiacus TaxID=1036182 RepID=A0A285KF90_9ACTN|nr:Pimeloyl-ACP methyl ester carboxylesterase [Actinoplanes atraurantiacus]